MKILMEVFAHGLGQKVGVTVLHEIVHFYAPFSHSILCFHSQTAWIFRCKGLQRSQHQRCSKTSRGHLFR